MNKHVALSIGAVSLAGLVLSANVIYAGATDGNAGVPGQISQLQQEVTALTATVSNQNQQIVTLQQGYSTLSQNQKDIQATQGLIEDEQSNIESELKGIETTQGSIKSTEQGIESTESSIESEQQGIEQQLAHFNQNLTNLENQVLQLQGASSSTGTSTGQNSGQATGYTVQGTLTNSSGNHFMTPIHLIDQQGNRYHADPVNDATGQFQVTNIPSGTYTVHFDMPEFQDSQPPTVTVNNGNVTDFQVVYPGSVYTVSGTAKLNGSALSNETIDVDDGYGSYGGFWGMTDQNGNFTINGLAPGTYTILIGSYRGQFSTAKATVSVTVSNSDIAGLAIGK